MANITAPWTSLPSSLRIPRHLRAAGDMTVTSYLIQQQQQRYQQQQQQRQQQQ